MKGQLKETAAKYRFLYLKKSQSRWLIYLHLKLAEKEMIFFLSFDKTFMNKCF